MRVGANPGEVNVTSARNWVAKRKANKKVHKRRMGVRTCRGRALWHSA